jgi:hypothetical protein
MRLVLLSSLTAMALMAQPSIEGHWTLDRSVSPSGLQSELAADLRIIAVGGHALQMNYTQSNWSPQQQRLIELDGLYHTTGESLEAAAATTLTAGLLICYHKTDSASAVSVMELWKLSEDGGTLTRYRQHPSSDEPDPVLVYRRMPDPVLVYGRVGRKL